MADDDFDNFEDEALGEEFGEELAPAPKPGQRKAPNPGPAPRRPAPQQQQPQRTVQTQAPASAPVQTQERARYAPYILPARTGIFDNQTARPLMEDPEKMDLMLAALTEILNRLDRIEAGL